jgi:hypothetical protein
VRTAMLYDHFTPYVLIQLEELGFCPRGEAKDFIADGAIELGGRLPLNTHGGQLGEAYIHGMNGIAEAVRQVRGTSVNQVPGDGPVLVTAGTGVPTSALILALPARSLMPGKDETGVQLLEVPQLIGIGVRAGVNGVGGPVVVDVPGHRDRPQIRRQREVGSVNSAEFRGDLGLSGDVLHADRDILRKSGSGVLGELDLGEELRERVSGQGACQLTGQADPIVIVLQDPDLHPVSVFRQFIHPSPNTSSSW